MTQMHRKKTVPPPVIPDIDIDELAQNQVSQSLDKGKTIKEITVNMHTKRLKSFLEANNMSRKTVYGDGDCSFNSDSFQVDLEDAAILRKSCTSTWKTTCLCIGSVFASHKQYENERYPDEIQTYKS